MNMVSFLTLDILKCSVCSQFNIDLMELFSLAAYNCAIDGSLLAHIKQRLEFTSDGSVREAAFLSRSFILQLGRFCGESFVCKTCLFSGHLSLCLAVKTQAVIITRTSILL